MLKSVKFLIKGIVWFILLIIAVIVIVIIWFTFTDYNPGIREPVRIAGEGLPYIDDTSALSILTWNIGYAGLGKDMDFFYDGGKQVRPSCNEFIIYQKGIFRTLERFDSVDFIFIQEVDLRAKRSYHSNQVEAIRNLLPSFVSMFAMNYNSKYVPLPINKPMGGVKGGLMTLSRFTPFEATRYSLQSSEAWPKKLFMLKRCYLLTRFKVSNGNELVLINTHNSAFAEASKLREKELIVLRKAMEEEYNKGNYVIVGGDWNQNPVPFNEQMITSGDAVMRIVPPIPDDFLPEGWQWAFDPSQPTNRDVIEAYKHGITKTTIYDFFVLSPNIKMIGVNTYSDGFEFSDHHPVNLKIKLGN